MKNTLLFHSSKSLLLTFISLTLLSLLATVLSSHPTSALTYQNETDVEFTINPTISVSLSSSDIKIEDLAPGSSKDSNIVTVSVSTNAGYGYYLSATAGTKTTNTDLTNTADSTYKFTNLSSNVASLTNIPDNNWGYSYSTDNGTTWVSGNAESTSTGYNGLPLDNNDEGATGIKLISSNAYAASGSVRFKIGAKASSTQPAGTYANVVNFYAVSNPAPKTIADSTTMQEVDSCPDSLPTGQVYTIKDSRDNTEYHTARLADGKCWLLDNLALDLTNSTVLNGMNENNTHASNTTLNYLKGTTTRDPSTDPDGQYATAGVSNWTSSYSYSAPLVNLTNKDIIPSDATSQAGQYKIGGYYNYCAASAGSYCYGNDTSEGTSSGNATEDICPKGWRMPTGETSGEYSALANAIYGSTDSTSDATAYANYRSTLRLPLSGSFVSGSASYQGSRGSFWSSTRLSNNYMYLLFLFTNSISPAYSIARNGGKSVRCVVE